MADKAYCSRKFLNLIVVERFFQRLKENRRIAMRFDKRADSFLTFVHFACIWLLLR